MIIFYTIIFLFSLIRPKIFIAVYLLHYTKYLGFFDSSILMFSIEIGTTLIHLIAFFSVLLNKNKLTKILKFEFNFLLALLIIGIFVPILFFEQSLLLSIIGAKQFFCISILGYLIVKRDDISLNFINKLIVFLGIYLSFSVLIYNLFKVYPPLYFIDDNFRAYTPILISLSCFFIYYNWLLKKINLLLFLALIIISMNSIFLSGHTSITLTTLILIPAHFLIINRSKIRINKIFLKFVVIFSLSFIALELKNVNIMSFKQSTSITSRDQYNEHRWNAISDSPLIGHGFSHHTSKHVDNYILSDYEDNRFMNRFEVVDSGYVDILIKFGYFGLIIILLFWSRLFIKYFLSNKNIFSGVLSLFIFQYFFINWTWSVFTQQIGLIPLFFALFTIIKANEANFNLVK